MHSARRHDHDPEESTPRAPGAPPGHRRFSPVPVPPPRPLRELDLHEECADPLAGLLWRALSDVALWSRVDEGAGETRGAVFQPGTRAADVLAVVPGDVPELAKPLRVLRWVSVAPEMVDAAGVAEACGEVAAWAEAQEKKRTALQFAEAAARVEPESSRRSYIAGRLCRRAGDFGMATIWFRRAVRLARLAKNEVDFANAHRGYGVVFIDIGQPDKAEKHLWKCVRAALRAGRKSLAGSGYHDLFAVAVDRGELQQALVYGQQAVALYKTSHPRFPNLAHDVAFFWCRQGYFSSALPIFKLVLPFMRTDVERMVVLASLEPVRDFVEEGRIG